MMAQAQTDCRGVSPSVESYKSLRLWDVETGRERTALRGHSGWIFGVAFAPDGQTLASASEDTTVKLWDVASGQELATLKGHTGYVYAVTFATDAETIATGGQDKTVRLWPLPRRLHPPPADGGHASIGTPSIAAPRSSSEARVRAGG